MLAGSTSEVLLLFSGDVALAGGAFPDGAFTVNGAAAAAVTQVTPAVVRVLMTNSVFAGASWSLSAQPNWLATPVDAPESGFVA